MDIISRTPEIFTTILFVAYEMRKRLLFKQYIIYSNDPATLHGLSYPNHITFPNHCEDLDQCSRCNCSLVFTKKLGITESCYFFTL
jgi:hypothetical protein